MLPRSHTPSAVIPSLVNREVFVSDEERRRFEPLLSRISEDERVELDALLRKPLKADVYASVKLLLDRWFHRRIVQESDPYQHLRSIHHSNVIYDHSKPWVTHVSIQGSDLEKSREYVVQYRKPVVFDECKYEGNIPKRWGNISAQELVRYRRERVGFVFQSFNLLPTFSNGYGYVVNAQDAKPKNHKGWKNDLNDCFFNGAAFGATYVTCDSQGIGSTGFSELSIALTGTTP